MGKIVAVFDTKKSHAGTFTKVITVTTNTKPANRVLTFSGEIVDKGGHDEHHDTAAPVASPKADKKTN
jgi:hypothetical protein